ncbi:MAG: hypothetical protein D6768_08150 [Chloroflexi bacterium]|nr:MAG: hypothetical protein D6768_08150 [Chloroflexota bacterium]
MPTLDDAIEKIRTGNKLEGRQILEGLLDVDENNEEIWLWMSTVVDNDEDREICLENALALDPENVAAQQGIEALKAGIFSADELLRELLEEEREGVEPAPPPATFLDDFVISDDDFVDDDDLPFPGEVKTSKRGGLNIKFIVIAVLVLVLLLVLAGLGVATWMLVSGGDNGGQSTPPASQEAPAQQPAATEVPAETPTPAPTDTPTVTPTPKLQLPTAKPTEEPTPTATTVVSPTPIK